MKMQSPKMEEKEQRKRPLMKAAQLLEFQMQTLVYRYIEAGLHVPQHLMVPIWNSLAFSSSMLSSNKGLNHIDMVKPPEPIRCRRTDGKKWRCGNTVLPFEKYCERHMHRGCKRSRKLVESSNEVGLDKNSVSQIGTVSVSCNDQAVTIASYPSARACDSVTHPSLLFSESTKKSDKSRRNMESSMCVRVAPVRGPMVSGDESLPSGRKLFPEVSDKSLEAAKISSNNDESLPACQKFFPEVCDNSLEAAKMSSNKKNDIIARSREWKNVNVNGSLFPSIHFSPDTVLQDRGGFHLHRVETDNEPGRCRRTDGKKWRCSKDALSGQKYCDKHMHRGSNKKKHQLDTKSHENATAKTTAGFVSCKGDDDDQKLSVTVMGISLPRVSDEKTTRSCSTETTITDTALRGEEDNEGLSLCSSGV